MNYLKKLFSFIQIYTEKELEKLYLSTEKRRIYHFHVRKTGGTSINYSFFHNSGFDDLRTFHLTLKHSPTHRVFANGRIYAAWNRTIINSGKYFYAYSHLPMHKLDIPYENVFTITCFRDPVKRFLSYYNMLEYYRQNKPDSMALRKEGKGLEKGLIDFATQVNPVHLKNQVYMFSGRFDYRQAAENVLKYVDFIMFTEELDDDLKTLERIVDLPLPSSRQRSYGYKAPVTDRELELLREILDDEYKFLDIIKKERSTDIDKIKEIANRKFASND